MIKNTLVAIISFYQLVLSALLKNVLGVSRFCRFDETCSEYTKRNIIEKGVLRGSALGFNRLLKCQPFYNEKLNGNI